jgi:hypothetical protein
MGGFRYSDWDMTAIRRRVRAVAFAWLLCQVASLSAFVPEDCCVSHAAEEAAKQKAEACHEEAAPAPVEPKEGDACPMHHGRSTQDDCTISNACGGPGQQLLTLFSFNSTIDEPIASSTLLAATPAFVPSAPPLLFRHALPDAPPPKA